MSHTPGPWTVELMLGLPVVLAPGRNIAGLTIQEGLGELRSNAALRHEIASNARLIAAAPDLLNACGWALFHMNLRGWSTAEGHELREVYEQVKAAIKKAEGEQ